jgi:limonene-1,2-epoxide hydrolase
MKQALVFFVAILGMYACTPSNDARNRENVALVEKYIKAVEAEDVELMASLLADGYKGYGPSLNDSITKEEAIANWSSNAESLYESIKYSKFQMIAVTIDGSEPMPGEWVSSWAESVIEYKDGRGPVTVWVNAVYKIKDGKIAGSRTFYNEADVLEQLGYTFVNFRE